MSENEKYFLPFKISVFAGFEKFKRKYLVLAHVYCCTYLIMRFQILSWLYIFRKSLECQNAYYYIFHAAIQVTKSYTHSCPDTDYQNQTLLVQPLVILAKYTFNVNTKNVVYRKKGNS